VLSSLPRHHNSSFARCGCKKHAMDFHADHTSSFTAHSGATKAHDWMVGFRKRVFFEKQFREFIFLAQVVACF
jgi:hypothetical protein